MTVCSNSIWLCFKFIYILDMVNNNIVYRISFSSKYCTISFGNSESKYTISYKICNCTSLKCIRIFSILKKNETVDSFSANFMYVGFYPIIIEYVADKQLFIYHIEFELLEVNSKSYITRH